MPFCSFPGPPSAGASAVGRGTDWHSPRSTRFALLPAGASGGWLLAIDLVIARVLVGGIITLRSTVRTLNHPGNARGQVTALPSTYTTLSITLTALLAGFFLDANAQSFRWIYLLGGLVASVGVVAFGRVRLVAERKQLRSGRDTIARPTPEGAVAPESAIPEPAAVAGRGLIALLREDPLFARYQLNQFLIGSGNGPLILLVSWNLDASYSVSIALMLVLSLTRSMGTPPLWAPWMERVHIAELRAKHSGLWGAVPGHRLARRRGARCSGSASAAPCSASPAAAASSPCRSAQSLHHARPGCAAHGRAALRRRLGVERHGPARDGCPGGAQRDRHPRLRGPVAARPAAAGVG